MTNPTAGTPARKTTDPTAVFVCAGANPHVGLIAAAVPWTCQAALPPRFTPVTNGRVARVNPDGVIESVTAVRPQTPLTISAPAALGVMLPLARLAVPAEVAPVSTWKAPAPAKA